MKYFYFIAKNPLDFSDNKNKSPNIKYNYKIKCKHIFLLILNYSTS